MVLAGITLCQQLKQKKLCDFQDCHLLDETYVTAIFKNCAKQLAKSTEDISFLFLPN